MPAPNDADRPIVELRNIGIDYPGVRALDRVDFDVRAGEIHALMGENGAGKSTLVNVLSGAVRMQEGSMSIDGQLRRLATPRAAERAGVSTVRQELDLIPTLSVAENICLCRRSGRWGFVSHRTMRQRARRALARLNLPLDVSRRLDECSLAMRQMVAIARAMDINARVLILDEPTSSLDSSETQRLFALMRRLRDSGLGILFITHYLDQVYAVADRITVLRNGRCIVTSLARELPRSQLVEAMTGRQVDEMSRRMDATSRSEHPARLNVDGLGLRRVIAPTSFAVAAGESLGFAGLLGSGRSELARLIFGVDQADSGTVSVDGQPLRGGSIGEAIAHGMAFSPEDRREALALDLSVRENIVLSMQASRGMWRSLKVREQRAIADRFIAALSIRTSGSDAPVRSLSGGNQQKVLLARWLAMQPRVLILDEPARGVDIGARAEIESVVRSMQSQGAAIVLISTEIDELARMCDRALVLRDRAPLGVIVAADEAAIVTMIAGEERVPRTRESPRSQK